MIMGWLREVTGAPRQLGQQQTITVMRTIINTINPIIPPTIAPSKLIV